MRQRHLGLSSGGAVPLRVSRFFRCETEGKSHSIFPAALWTIDDYDVSSPWAVR
jgi:hypothetical protein